MAERKYLDIHTLEWMMIFASPCVTYTLVVTQKKKKKKATKTREEEIRGTLFA